MQPANVMENSNTPQETQDPPVTEPMVEAAARAMCAEEGSSWDELNEVAPSSLHIFSRADWRVLARVALIAGIAAALEKGR